MKPKLLLAFLSILALPLDAWAVQPAQSPLFITSPVEPRVMLLMSRDHELSKKAYTDYSDLDGDGVLDTTYKDSINYYGYFDPDKCYTYSSDIFSPSAAVTTGTHQCNGSTWSGNFLNWASMTRMDVVRKTYYGGYRSTDSTTSTILERHFLPNDVHAFVKVYNPGSATTLGLYIPTTLVNGNTSISLCNVTDSTESTLTGKMAFPLPTPLIKVAAGPWPQWDASDGTQCTTGSGTRPSSTIGTYNARVKVCDSTAGLESNCKTYGTSNKPIGLIQEYGDVDASPRTRFGLMTGSYKANKSGGVLRKNIGHISDNNNDGVCGNHNSNDEIDVCTGQFINQDANKAGIINTLNRLHIAGWRYEDNKYQYQCDSPGKLTFNNGDCVDWGNPLSEMYLETLRYFAKAGATTAFDQSDSDILSSIPTVTWSDPLPATEWCALSSIVVMSTGLNSFDTDELTSFTPTGGTAIEAATLTKAVGDAAHENINGGTYMVGDNGGSTGLGQCTAKVVSDLATAKGICPQMPNTQGGYGIAGLAYAPKTIDLRPSYASKRNTRWGSVKKDWALRQPLTTYAVQLAESLPSFSPATGMTLLPACQANSDGNPGAWTSNSSDWRNCSMTNLVVDTNVASGEVGTDTSAKTKTCSGNGTTSGCFTITWEDSSWGNDYDTDGIQRLGYCVGAACSSFKMLCPTNASANATVGPWFAASDQVIIATCVTQANAGHTLTFGYTTAGTSVLGSSTDGVHFPIYRKGGSDFSVGSTLPSAPPDITAPTAATYTISPSSAQLLKNPLWYAAKYGGFTESTPETGTPSPNLASEWDTTNNSTGALGADGIPDNYFDVRNPAQLYDRLADVFERAAVKESSSSSVATNSTRLDTQSVVYQAKFSSEDWSGQLVAYELNTDGTLGDEKWNTDSAGKIPAAASRNIKTYDGTQAVGARGVVFAWGNLSCTQKAYLNKADPTACPGNDNSGGDGQGSNRLNWLRGENVTGMRARTKLLGDIVNSDPIFVKTENFGHIGYTTSTTIDDQTTYVDTYLEYLETKKTRTPMIYIGANDGMLHAFNADTGVETFAYVPNAVFENLYKLTDPAYSHQYYVDGTFGLGDAYFDAGDGVKWHTILVGTLGAGGRAVFALDVTNPENIKVLWERDDKSIDAGVPGGWANLGYVIGAPAVTSVLNNYFASHGGTGLNPWTAVFGNGYDSSAQKAMLFIVDLPSGAIGDLVDTGSGDASSQNGLSSPALYIAPVTRQFKLLGSIPASDAIYAGDLLGNLWKFKAPASFGVSSHIQVAYSSAGNPAPLFIATDGTNRQPITAPLEIGETPSGKTGVMLYFGTGRYFASGDQAGKSLQSLYGIWDSGAAIGTASNRAQLVQQTITNQFAVDTREVRVVSKNGVSLTDTGGSRVYGWYMNLIPPSPATAEGEKVISAPLLRHGRVIFTTLVPSTEACSYGGNSWLMELDAQTGGRLSYSVFDLNNDQLFNELDFVDHDNDPNTAKVPVSGLRLDTGISKTPAVISAGETEYKVTSGTSGEILITKEKGMTSHPRASWREIREE